MAKNTAPRVVEKIPGSVVLTMDVIDGMLPFQIVKRYQVTLPQALAMHDSVPAATGPGGKGVVWLMRRIESILKAKPARSAKRNPYIPAELKEAAKINLQMMPHHVSYAKHIVSSMFRHNPAPRVVEKVRGSFALAGEVVRDAPGPWQIVKEHGIPIVKAQAIYDAGVRATGPGGLGIVWLQKRVDSILSAKPSRKNPRKAAPWMSGAFVSPPEPKLYGAFHWQQSGAYTAKNAVYNKFFKTEAAAQKYADKLNNTPGEDDTHVVRSVYAKEVKK